MGLLTHICQPEGDEGPINNGRPISFCIISPPSLSVSLVSSTVVCCHLITFATREGVDREAQRTYLYSLIISLL